MVRLSSIPNINSSFLSCEKDMETILRKLFIDAGIYSKELKRLLLISNKDCLDDRDNPAYISLVDNTSLADLRDNGYIKLEPKITFGQSESIKAYIIIEFNNFVPNDENPEYRDCTIDFNIICHTDCWDIGNYRLRPVKIMGYIDGILNNTKLSGIGTLNFLGANEVVLDENLSGFILRYSAVHGSDDLIPVEE